MAAFEVWGYAITLGTVIGGGLGLSLWSSLSYRLATRYTKKRYRGIPE